MARPLRRRLPQLPVVGDEPALLAPRAEGHAVRGLPPPAGEAAAARRRRRVRDDRPNLRRRRLLRDARRRRAQPRGRRGAVRLRARAGGVGPLRPPRQPGARDAAPAPISQSPSLPHRPCPVSLPSHSSPPPPRAPPGVPAHPDDVQAEGAARVRDRALLRRRRPAHPPLARPGARAALSPPPPLLHPLRPPPRAACDAPPHHRPSLRRPTRVGSTRCATRRR